MAGAYLLAPTRGPMTLQQSDERSLRPSCAYDFGSKQTWAQHFEPIAGVLQPGINFFSYFIALLRLASISLLINYCFPFVIGNCEHILEVLLDNDNGFRYVRGWISSEMLREA